MSKIGNMRRSTRGILRTALAASVASAAVAMALASSVPARAQAQPAPAAAVSQTAPDVRSTLSQYGTFVVHQKYGEVWIPTVTPPGWHPYMACHWRNDARLGWFYDDATPWGAIVHHYGRWAHDADAGWMWIPGAEFSPGWVAWRASPDWIGWAPLPPDEDIQTAAAGSFDHADFWTFMATAKFDQGCVDSDVVGPAQIQPILQRTTYVTEFQMVDGIVVAALPTYVVGPQVHIDFAFDPWPEWFFAQTLLDWNWFWNNVSVVINVNTPNCPPSNKPGPNPNTPTPPPSQTSNNGGDANCPGGDLERCLHLPQNNTPTPPPNLQTSGNGGNNTVCEGPNLAACLSLPPPAIHAPSQGTTTTTANNGGGKTSMPQIQCQNGVGANGQCNPAPAPGGTVVVGIACPSGPAVNGKCPDGNGATGEFTKCGPGDHLNGNACVGTLPPIPPTCPDGVAPSGNCYLPGTNPNSQTAQKCAPPLVARGNFCVAPTFTATTVNPASIKTLGSSAPVGGATPPPPSPPRPAASGAQATSSPPPSMFAPSGGEGCRDCGVHPPSSGAGGNIPPRVVGTGAAPSGPSAGTGSPRPSAPSNWPTISGPRPSGGGNGPSAPVVLAHGGGGAMFGGGPRSGLAGPVAGPRPGFAGPMGGASAPRAMPTTLPHMGMGAGAMGGGLPRLR
jgi:hypothetical protein